ncbi:MAG: TetR/AcrR family transcriptional regulator C-terminal domain-containing protein [Austwickia sp.]|nr:TetR/AcrR family transcriptional regulator C-terminal domain-containing protein [Austwickia sp.]
MARRGLTRALVLDAAMRLADTEGLDALTMRSLAAALGVEAMSLYHHVPGKDALLDEMVDRVYAEVPPPAADRPWREGLRRRSLAMREVLRRHPWALPLIESRRTPGPANLAYHEATIACLRAAGFSAAQTAHAYAVLDAYVYGFVLQETMLPFDTGEQAVEFITDGLGDLLDDYPQMAWFAREVVLAPGYSFAREFEPGLDLVLTGIAAVRGERGTGQTDVRDSG